MTRAISFMLVISLFAGTCSADQFNSQSVPTPLLSTDIQTLISMNSQCLAQVAQLQQQVKQQTDSINALVSLQTTIWQDVGPVLLKYVLPAVGTFIAGLKLR